jgi:hypothetical protein
MEKIPRKKTPPLKGHARSSLYIAIKKKEERERERE